MRTMIVVVLLLSFQHPVFAGEIYKCKGPKGEITFTNIKCPDHSKGQAYSSYAPTPDSPSPYRRGRTYVSPEASQGYGSLPISNPAVAAASASAPQRPSAYTCLGAGKTWIQSSPCPDTTTAYQPAFLSGVDQYGRFVQGSGAVVQQVPVQQQGLSHSDLCDRLRAHAAVSENGLSDPRAAYERNKMRQADGC